METNIGVGLLGLGTVGTGVANILQEPEGRNPLVSKIKLVKIAVRDIKRPRSIKINNSKLISEKYTFNATKHPKDKGPFPEYTLWYHDNELLKMEFKNPKDKKTIKIIRNDWGQ